jgi:hypothetical protein
MTFRADAQAIDFAACEIDILLGLRVGGTVALN